MKVTIEALEEYLRSVYGGKVGEQALFMKLVEEVGETAEVLNMRSGAKKADGSDLDARLTEELTDVLHYVAAIAAVNGLDLNESVISKDKKAAVKYGKTTNLEEFHQKYKDGGER